MSRTRVPSLLHDVVFHAERVRACREMFSDSAAFLSDQTAKDAVLWNFVVMGEVCARLGEHYCEEHPEIPWRAVIGHRNIIAHGYDIVNWDLILDVIDHHLPRLIAEAKRLLSSYGPPPA